MAIQLDPSDCSNSQPAGNASLRRPDMAAYFRSVSEVLDIVDARTEPGPLRDRLYLRWYRGIASTW